VTWSCTLMPRQFFCASWRQKFFVFFLSIFELGNITKYLMIDPKGNWVLFLLDLSVLEKQNSSFLQRASYVNVFWSSLPCCRLWKQWIAIEMATSLELMVLATRMKSWRSHLIFSLEESIRQTERSYIISYTSYAYMADHSVVIRDKLYEARLVGSRCFVLTMRPQKSLASLTIWSALFHCAYKFLKLSTSVPTLLRPNCTKQVLRWNHQANEFQLPPPLKPVKTWAKWRLLAKCGRWHIFQDIEAKTNKLLVPSAIVDSFSFFCFPLRGEQANQLMAFSEPKNRRHSEIK